MNTPSEEQAAIIQAVTDGENVSVDAVAGSGKTTTVLHLAKANPDKSIIQITYNKRLKDEVRKKVTEFKMTNLEVHTYHSFAVKYYDRRAIDDDKLNNVVRDKLPLLKRPKIDILVVDECRDMTKNLYKFIKKILIDLSNDKIQLLFLGDYRQSIYTFRGADSRFLTLASRIWRTPIITRPLMHSYRLTHQIAWFVNNCMMDTQHIVADKSGPKVKFYHGDIWSEIPRMIAKIISQKLQDKKITASDIFVLTPSLKGSNTPFQRLENILVANRIPCYVSNSDAPLGEDSIKNKVVFTTFHQAKGCERKMVIICGFDSCYFEYYARKRSSAVCPPELYVAVTRASKYLYLIEDTKRASPLPFLNFENLRNDTYIEHIGKYNSDPRNSEPRDEQTQIIAPSELVKFLSEDNMNFCEAKVRQLMTIEKPASKNITIPMSMTCQNGLVEDIYDLNGMVIPVMWVDSAKNLTENIFTQTFNSTQHNEVIQRHVDTIRASGRSLQTIDNYLYLGNIYWTTINELHYRIEQIDSYSWLTSDMVDECKEVLNENVSPNIMSEVPIFAIGNGQDRVDRFTQKAFREDMGKFIFSGYLDAVDDETVWEFKCVAELSLEHKLQLIVYAWMWRMFNEKTKGKRQFKLLNIRTGEVWILNQHREKINDVVKNLLENKYKKREESSDEEFIAECLAE